MEQEKKISFGFSKSTKKANLFQKPSKNNDIQLIDCLEAQRIKIKGKVEEIKTPLIIPMVQSSMNVLDRRRQLKVQQEEDQKLDSELTADEIAARELIKEAQNKNENREQKIFKLPIITENTVELEGKEESTLEDYETVPISDYGLAMLRGMGWSDGSGIGKNNAVIKMVEPELRPKGMGLGVTNTNQLQSHKTVDKDGKELILIKGGFAKITDGKNKGSYCQIQGFDDEAGRVIVKTALQGLVLSLNEFLVIPVTKEEYNKCSKVINIVQYEEYKNKTKNKEEKPIIAPTDKLENEDRTRRKEHKNGQHKDEHRHKSYSKNSYSSEDVSSDEHRHKEKSQKSHKYKKHKSKKSKDKKYRYSSDSDSDRYKYDKHKNKYKNRHSSK